MSSMHSPYEELEYLADFLPQEGESVVVTRRSGELVCESFRQPTTSRTDALDDAVFFGRLVQANQRLKSLTLEPFALGAVASLWLGAGLRALLGLGLEGWFIDVSCAVLLGLAALAWSRHRRDRLFRTEVRPVLVRQMQRRGLDKYTLIGAVRKRNELRSLSNDLARWLD